jgi:hypothetical protein
MTVVLCDNTGTDIRLSDEHAGAVADALWDIASERGAAYIAASLTEELRRPEFRRASIHLNRRQTGVLAEVMSRLTASGEAAALHRPRL